jgi:hypothetical protein
MSNNDLILYGGIFVVALVVILYLYNWWNEKKATRANPEAAPVNSPTLNLRLQAYERLVLLAERISLPSLVTRIPSGELTAKQMQAVLVDQIKTEFDYNLSQQIYVAPTAWQAVSNLKEQNIYIVNQVANTLPQDAKGSELSRRIVDLLNADPQASLHPIVLDAINFEAKKIM